MDSEHAKALNAGVTTSRLVLEPCTSAHAALMFGAMQDPEIYRWISMVPPTSPDALADAWARAESRRSPAGDRAWLSWIVRSAGDGTCLGWVDSEVGGCVALNLGYVIYPSHWGRGIATEAVGAVVGHLEAHGIERHVALVTVGNTASMRVLDKLGFERTRVLVANDTIRGELHDEIEFVRDVRRGA